MKPFLFVVGCERSGTTLLRAMLDSHRDLAVPPESHFLVPLLREEFSKEGFLSFVGEHRRFARWELPIGSVATSFVEDDVNDLASAVRTLYKTYAAAKGKSRWGDKTPGYARSINGLSHLLPEAHFVHIIRDGRDVALSWLDTPFGPKSIEEAAKTWRMVIRAARRGARKHAPDRYLEVRYEALVSEPAEVLKSICEVGDLPFDPGMLEYPRKAEDIIEKTMSPSSHKGLRKPPTRGLRDWRSEMSPEDVARFQDEAGGLLSKLGYELL